MYLIAILYHLFSQESADPLMDCSVEHIHALMEVLYTIHACYISYVWNDVHNTLYN